MPKYTGPITLGDGARMQIDEAVLPPAFTENLSTSKFGSRWISSGVRISKTWHDISAAGDNWGTASIEAKMVFRIDVVAGAPWERFGFMVTSAHIWSNVGGTGTFNIACGTKPSHNNVINQVGLAAGLEWRSWTTADFDASYERGRLVDRDDPRRFQLAWDGTGLTSGPTGAVSISVFGVIIPDPSASDS